MSRKNRKNIDALPPILLQKIFSFVVNGNEISSLATLRLVNHFWQNLSQPWREKLQNTVRSLPLLPSYLDEESIENLVIAENSDPNLCIIFTSIDEIFLKFNDFTNLAIDFLNSLEQAPEVQEEEPEIRNDFGGILALYQSIESFVPPTVENVIGLDVTGHPDVDQEIDPTQLQIRQRIFKTYLARTILHAAFAKVFRELNEQQRSLNIEDLAQRVDGQINTLGTENRQLQRQMRSVEHVTIGGIVLALFLGVAGAALLNIPTIPERARNASGISLIALALTLFFLIFFCLRQDYLRRIAEAFLRNERSRNHLRLWHEARRPPETEPIEMVEIDGNDLEAHLLDGDDEEEEDDSDSEAGLLGGRPDSIHYPNS